MSTPTKADGCFWKDCLVTYLKLNTGHITAEDADKLEVERDLIVDRHAYGFYVYGLQDEDLVVSKGYSDRFLKILRFVRDRRIPWVDFDCDGRVCKSFDWEAW